MKTRPKKQTKTSAKTAVPNLPPQVAVPSMIDVLSAAIAQKVVPLVTRGIERSQLDKEITPGGAPGLQAARPLDKAISPCRTAAPTLDAALDEQEKAVAHLHEVCSILGNLLEPVLEPESTNGCGIGTEVEATPPVSLILGRVQNGTRGVVAAVMRLSQVMGRLQIGGAR